ncbi:arginase [Stylonychia lemnae]|uniref:Arginase n=1 Tax=Stylonychia lemnae TaxID=5949 RepID=A0A078AFT0_STYLE|nr:arginase [Stylonychia lemnae]|eukprot:CDW81120.1 arginase [Stylonychia lemnae]
MLQSSIQYLKRGFAKQLNSSQQRFFSTSIERHVHVIGFPFAGGQQRPGPEEAPEWLLQQKFLQNRNGVSTEMVNVTNRKCNQAQDKDIIDGHRKGERNWHNVYQSNVRLESSVIKSLHAKQFPVIFGGDHSQGIGSINGLKAVYPKTKILWIDAHVDANTPESSLTGDIHGGPVAYLTGLAKYEQPPVLSLRDIVYFGLRQWEPEEKQLLDDREILWFKSEDCLAERMDVIKKNIESYLFPNNAERVPYWISFDIDGVTWEDFRSTGTPESKGIPLSFMLQFFETFIPEAYGMDFTEVNFRLSEGEQTDKDKETVKLLMEKIIDVVHKQKFKYPHQL